MPHCNFKNLLFLGHPSVRACQCVLRLFSCDRYPAAVARYVVALVKKKDMTEDELKENCTHRLHVFLQDSEYIGTARRRPSVEALRSSALLENGNNAILRF